MMVEEVIESFPFIKLNFCRKTEKFNFIKKFVKKPSNRRKTLKKPF